MAKFPNLIGRYRGQFFIRIFPYGREKLVPAAYFMIHILSQTSLKPVSDINREVIGGAFGQGRYFYKAIYGDISSDGAIKFYLSPPAALAVSFEGNIEFDPIFSSPRRIVCEFRETWEGTGELFEQGIIVMNRL